MIRFSVNRLLRIEQVSLAVVFCTETSSFAWPYFKGWLHFGEVCFAREASGNIKEMNGRDTALSSFTSSNNSNPEREVHKIVELIFEQPKQG
jgi:hypothetical protein